MDGLMDGMGQVDGWMDETGLGNEKQMSQVPVRSYHGCFLLFANVSMVAGGRGGCKWKWKWDWEWEWVQGVAGKGNIIMTWGVCLCFVCVHGILLLAFHFWQNTRTWEAFWDEIERG
jgi:hypothetical protein